MLEAVVAIGVHVLGGVFWAGTTMTVAILGQGNRRLFVMQMIAAVVAVLAGTYLWHTFHAGSFGTTERLLAVGAGCALAALALQAGALAQNRAGRTVPAGTVRAVNAVAGCLLSVTIATMAASRYL